MTQSELDKNLLVVTAVQGYAENHHETEENVYKEFEKYNILPLVREEFDVLHTQPLEETVNFVEDVMSRLKKKQQEKI